jgi:hypothetical protein
MCGAVASSTYIGMMMVDPVDLGSRAKEATRDWLRRVKVNPALTTMTTLSRCSCSISRSTSSASLPSIKPQGSQFQHKARTARISRVIQRRVSSVACRSTCMIAYISTCWAYPQCIHSNPSLVQLLFGLIHDGGLILPKAPLGKVASERERDNRSG